MKKQWMLFLAGGAAGAFARDLLTYRDGRKGLVNLVAGVLKSTNWATVRAELIKEDIEDIVAEAHEQNKAPAPARRESPRKRSRSRSK